MPDPSSRSRDLALIATFAGITAALGVVPALYPFGTAVPITAQSFGVMLAGSVIGARRGALSLVLLLALVALGLPLLSGGRGGLGVFVGPTVGYLIGWPVAALLIGSLVGRMGAPYRLDWGILVNLLGGIVVLYAIGVPVSAWRAGTSVEVATKAAALFLPGDVLKAVVAAFIARGVHAAYPGLLRARRLQAAAPAPLVG